MVHHQPSEEEVKIGTEVMRYSSISSMQYSSFAALYSVPLAKYYSTTVVVRHCPRDSRQ